MNEWVLFIILMAITFIQILALILGVKLIRNGVEQDKTWKTILGVLLCGFLIGLVYFYIVKERKRTNAERKAFDEERMVKQKIDKFKSDYELKERIKSLENKLKEKEKSDKS